MQIVKYNPDMRREWDEYVFRHNSGTIFHTIAWKNVLERAFGFKAMYMAARDAGQLEGIFPLFLVSNPISGRTLISTPFAVYGGPCANSESAKLALLQRACDIAIREDVEYLELRIQEPTGIAGMQTKKLYARFDCAIEPDQDLLYSSIPKDVKYMIRRSQREGMYVTRGKDQFDAFYKVFAFSVRNLGTPVFSKTFFRIVMEELGEAAEPTVIWKDRTPVATAMTFLYRGSIHPYYAGSTLVGRKLAANNFMYWELLDHSRARGIPHFDFGRSKIGTGSYTFKKQWNMRESLLPYEFFLVRRKTLPNFSQSARILSPLFGG